MSAGPAGPLGAEACARRHLRFGWWSLAVFLTFGVVLETLHAFKVGSYLNAANQTRRLMWTLAHSHGTLLALLNLIFALALRSLAPVRASWLGVASRCLIAATVLMPGGFLLGGVVIYAGDPGVGILLVPIGALALLVAVVLGARHLSGAGSATR